MQKIKSLFDKSIHIDSQIFTIWRLLFGIYFVYYAIRMIPYLAEIYGTQGLVSNVSLNWTYGIFPNIFYVFDGSHVALIIHIIIIIAGLFLSLGYFPRVSAVVLWYLQTALYNRNNLTDDPSMAYVGLLLLTLALIPHQPTPIGEKRKTFEIPYFVFFVPVFIFCLTFTTSAIDKFMSTSWIHGTALFQMLGLGIARDNFFVHTLLVHPRITEVFSYLAVLSQLVCLPLFVVGWYRWALGISFFSFSFVFLVLDLNQVIYGMLFFYSFFLLVDLPFVLDKVKLFYKKLR